MSDVNSGWAYPIAVENGKVKTVGGAENLKQGLMRMIETTPGERVMRPLFGCDLSQFVFENMTKVVRHGVVNELTDAIARSEPRAKLTSVVIDTKSNEFEKMAITLHYTDLSDEKGSLSSKVT